MPTYTYQCQECGDTLDVFHSITAKPRIRCESCGTRMRRLLGTGAGIIFKGSGFYETDYKKSSSGKAETAPESKPEAKSETKSESKPEKASKRKDGGSRNGKGA